MSKYELRRDIEQLLRDADHGWAYSETIKRQTEAIFAFIEKRDADRERAK